MVRKICDCWFGLWSYINTLQLEGILCKHMWCLVLIDVIHLKHMCCSCFTLSGLCLNTCQKTPNLHVGSVPFSIWAKSGVALTSSVCKFQIAKLPFPRCKTYASRCRTSEGTHDPFRLPSLCLAHLLRWKKDPPTRNALLFWSKIPWWRGRWSPYVLY